MREMLAVILAGLAAGAAGAYLSGRYVETQLFGIKPVDGLVGSVANFALGELVG